MINFSDLDLDTLLDCEKFIGEEQRRMARGDIVPLEQGDVQSGNNDESDSALS